MKKILLTFDYELYFGANSGTQANSIIKPTERIRSMLAKYHVKGTFFVDAGYLLKLKFYKADYPSLEQDYKSLVNQIQLLALEGHEIQLHIHPHWEDSYYDGQKWVMDTSRYRLHDFSKEEVEDIVKRYKEVLTKLIDNKIFVFRAGGWCLQPFSHLKEALKKHGIYLDSTVYQGGKNESVTHYFNFKNAPEMSKWQFEDDPLKVEAKGFFIEVPIASYKLSPWFFWKFLYLKKFGGAKHKVFGDGMAAGGSIFDKLRMLTQTTHSVVSMDGYKSSFLLDAYQAFLENKVQENFVVIGHPKAMSEYSLEKLEAFILKSQKRQCITYKEFDDAVSNNQQL
jgi:peptidoglycan/xylan/chitin deacetylase (PgdA/CDA1 family)